MNNEFYKSILETLLKTNKIYIKIETKFTESHIEKIMNTARDRGKWKWFAETKHFSFNELDKSIELPEAQCSHIDHGDLFPRIYFNDDCFIKEFFSWISIRNLTVTDITTPKI